METDAGKRCESNQLDSLWGMSSIFPCQHRMPTAFYNGATMKLCRQSVVPVKQRSDILQFEPIIAYLKKTPKHSRYNSYEPIV